MHHPSLIAALTASLAALPVVNAGLYSKSSPVLQIDARSYDRLIAKSNHTSIVEFYAPWCGHCKNLQPAYEKAAGKLDGLAKVAAVDCDEEANKQFCGSMGVQGFPTLKIVRPSKKAGGKPVVEDYQGPRTASGIVENVVGKINNHVKRLADKDLEAFLEGDKPKAILFTEKGTTSALLRSVAIDFLDVISVGQVRNKEKEAVDKFGITSFPTLVLIPKGQDPITYNGELNKKGLVEFLKQVREPNPDPAPASSKASKKPSTKATKEQASKETEESSTTSSSKTAAAAAPEFTIPAITSRDVLEEECLYVKSFSCVLVLVPASSSETAKKAISSLSQLNSKYIVASRHLFPFYSVSSDLEGSDALREALGLKGKVEIIMVNGRRNWWKRYDGDFSIHSVEAWADMIRVGEGEKKPFPEGVVLEKLRNPRKKVSVKWMSPKPTKTATDAPEESGHDEL